MDYKFMGKRLVTLEAGLVIPRERVVHICLDVGCDIEIEIAAQEQAGDYQLSDSQRKYIWGYFPLDDRFSGVHFSFDVDSDITDDSALVVFVRKPVFPMTITRGA